METTSVVQTTINYDLVKLWEAHETYEFISQDVESAISTMTDDAYVHLIPIQFCAHGKEAVKEFYSNQLIGKIPPDVSFKPISRTVGEIQIVEERSYSLTHTQEIFLLPGIPPTNKFIEFSIIIIVGFRDGKIAYERLYWDQVSVLEQIGLLPGKL